MLINESLDFLTPITLAVASRIFSRSVRVPLENILTALYSRCFYLICTDPYMN